MIQLTALDNRVNRYIYKYKKGYKYKYNKQNIEMVGSPSSSSFPAAQPSGTAYAPESR